MDGTTAEELSIIIRVREEVREAFERVRGLVHSLSESIAKDGRAMQAALQRVFAPLGILGDFLAQGATRLTQWAAGAEKAGKASGALAGFLGTAAAKMGLATIAVGALAAGVGLAAAKIAGPLTRAVEGWLHAAVEQEQQLLRLTSSLAAYEDATGQSAGETEEWEADLRRLSVTYGIMQSRLVEGTVRLIATAGGLKLTREQTLRLIETAAAFGVQAGRPFESVLLAMQAAMRGNTRGLAQMGLVLNQSAVGLKAVGAGASDTGGKLTQAQRAARIFNEIMRVTGDVIQRAAEIMDKSLQGAIDRTNVALANLREKLGAGAAAVRGPFMRAWADFLQLLDQQLPAGFLKTVGAIVTTIETLIRGGAQLLKWAGLVLGLIGVLKLASAALGVFQLSLSGVLLAGGQWLALVVSLVAIVALFVTSLKKLADATGFTAEISRQLGVAWRWVKDAGLLLLDTLEAIFGKLPAGATAFDSLATRLTQGFLSVINLAIEAIGALSSVYATLLEKAATAAEFVGLKAVARGLNELATSMRQDAADAALMGVEISETNKRLIVTGVAAEKAAKAHKKHADDVTDDAEAAAAFGKQLAELQQQLRAVDAELALSGKFLAEWQALLARGTTASPVDLQSLAEAQDLEARLLKLRQDSQRQIETLRRDEAGLGTTRVAQLVAVIQKIEQSTEAQIRQAAALAQTQKAAAFTVGAMQDAQDEIDVLIGKTTELDVRVRKAMEAAQAAHLSPEQVASYGEAIRQVERLRKEQAGFLDVFEAGTSVSKDFWDSVVIGGRKASDYMKTLPAAFGRIFTDAFFQGLKAKSGFDDKFKVNIFDLVKNMGEVLTGRRGIGAIFEDVFKQSVTVVESGATTLAAGFAEPMTAAAQQSAIVHADAAQQTFAQWNAAQAGVAQGASTLAGVNAQAAQASSSAWGGFFGFLLQIAQSVIGQVVGLFGGLVQAIFGLLGKLGGAVKGALGGVVGAVGGLFGGGGGAGTGGGVIGAIGGFFNTLGSVLNVGKIANWIGNFLKIGDLFGALKGVLGGFGSALGGAINFIGGLGGAVTGVVGLFRRGASSIERFLSSLDLGNSALNLFGLGLRSISGVGPGGGTALSALGRIFATFGGSADFVGPTLGFGAKAPGVVGLVEGLGKLFKPILDVVQAVLVKVGVVAANTGTVAAETAATAASAGEAATSGANAASTIAPLATQLAAGLSVVGGLAGLALGIKQALQANNAQGKAAGATAAAGGAALAGAGVILLATGTVVWPLIIVALVLIIVAAILTALNKPNLRRMLSDAFAKNLSDVLGREVSAEPGRRQLSRGVRENLPGAQGAVGILAGASVFALGNAARASTHIFREFRQILTGALAEANVEQFKRDVTRLIVRMHGSLLGVFRNFNAFLNLAQEQGFITGPLGGRARTQRVEGTRLIGDLFEVAGVKMGEIFAQHVAASGRIVVREALVEARKAAILGVQGGAELTRRDARRFGDPFLIILNELEERVPPAINLMALAFEVAARGVKDHLSKAGEELALGGVRLVRRLNEAVRIQTALFSQGLPQLASDEAAEFGEFVQGARTRRGRRRRREVGTIGLTARAGIDTTLAQFAAESTGQQAVFAAAQAERQRAAAEFGLESVLENLPRRGRKRKEALEQIPQFAEQATQAVQQWAQSVVDLVQRIRDVRQQMEDFALSTGETIDQLRNNTNTAARYANVIDLTRARLDKATSAAERFGIINRIMDLLQRQAQAEIRDIEEAAEKRREAISDELEAIAPLAQLAESIRAQISQLQLDIVGGPGGGFEKIGLLQQRVLEAQERFRTSTGEDRARAAADLQALVGQMLEVGGTFFGTESLSFASLQQDSLAILQEIGASADDAAQTQEALLADLKTIDEETRDKIDAVNKTLADQLEYWQLQAQPELEGMHADLLAQLKSILPEGTSIDDVVNNPQLYLTAELARKLEQIRLLLSQAAGLGDDTGDETEDRPDGRDGRDGGGGGGAQTRVVGLERSNGRLLLRFAGPQASGTAAIGPSRDWVAIQPDLWAFYHQGLNAVRIWHGTNPPGAAGGPGHAGQLGEDLAVPLAAGGIALRPILAMLGERRQAEAVIPLDSPRAMGMLAGAIDTHARARGPAGPAVVVHFNPTIVLNPARGEPIETTRLRARTAYDTIEERFAESLDHGAVGRALARKSFDKQGG